MAELDFSKIFGETATSKASFTDENYLNGWGYLGSTPPPYQLFDYLQGLNDKKSKYLYDSLNESKNNLLAHNTDSSAHTALLNAHNADVNAHSPILNAIKTITGTSAYDIAPSKTIEEIITLLGFGGIVAQSIGVTGYVKFANGFIVQWGKEGVNPSKTVTFPIAYTTAYQPFACHIGETVISTSINPTSNTAMTVMDSAGTGSARAISWVTLGF